jgi:hypothetical protein
VWLAGGCETAAQKCGKARDAAGAAWATYIEALAQARTAADNAQRDAQARLTGEIEPRLAPIAQQAADVKYPRSSEAWLRAYRIAYEDACARDQECNRLRDQATDARSTLEDFADRVPLAQAAMRAQNDDVEAAKRAASVVPLHPEYVQLKQAQQLSQVAYERCKDVPAHKAGAKP